MFRPIRKIREIRVKRKAVKRKGALFAQFAADALQLGLECAEAVHHFGGLQYAFLVFLEHIAGSRQFEAAHLHEVVDGANLLNVLFGVLADVASRLLGFDLLRKLLLPESEEGFVHLKHFGYLADGVVELEFFIGVEGHSAWVLCSLWLP